MITAGTWVFLNLKGILNIKKVIDYYVLNGLIRIWSLKQWDYLETECRLFPPVTIFLDLFPHAGYFFNALY